MKFKCLSTLLARSNIEKMIRFSKWICRINKEDCAFNLRCRTSIFVWHQFCLTSENEKLCFFNFFWKSVSFHLKRRESWKKTLTKIFPSEFSKKTYKFFFNYESIQIMSFQNFCCWSHIFSHAELIWKCNTLNWRRNPPGQFYIPFSKIESCFHCQNVRAKCSNI